MTKNVYPDLLAAHEPEVVTLTTCWLITRTDGAVFGYTHHDKDLLIDGVVYKARSGFDPTNIETTLELNVDTVQANGVIGVGTGDITLRDVVAGLWDGAQVSVFQIDYTDVTKGRVPQRCGWMGEIKVSGKGYAAEVRGMMQALQQQIGRIQMAACGWDFCDSNCQLAIQNFTYSGTVTGIGQSQRELSIQLASFFGSPSSIPVGGLTYLIFRAIDAAGGLTSTEYGKFTGGKITFTSGLNDGLSMEVKSHIEISGGEQGIRLQTAMPFEVVAGDAFTITEGCDKSESTCRTRFNNFVNFGGYPDIPGLDALATQPKQAETS